MDTFANAKSINKKPFRAIGLFDRMAGQEDMSKAKKKKENYSKKRKPFSEEFLWLLLLGLWMAGIYIASATEGSGEYYYNLKMIIERKGAHVVEFFVLAFLFWKFLRYSVSDLKRMMIFVFIFSLSYAVSDEFHQLFVFGREGKLSDVGIDCVGIIIFIISILFFKKIMKQKIP